MTEQLTIARLGHRGDGVADTNTGPAFIAYTLPGETVTVERVDETDHCGHLVQGQRCPTIAENLVTDVLRASCAVGAHERHPPLAFTLPWLIGLGLYLRRQARVRVNAPEKTAPLRALS